MPSSHSNAHIHNHAVHLSLSQVLRYCNLIQYSILTTLIVFNSYNRNPLMKIVFACYIGVYSINLLGYSVVIYFKSIVGTEEKKDVGLIEYIMNFLPMMIEKLSSVLIQLIYFALIRLQLVAGNTKKMVQLNSSLIAYFLINLRKIISFLVWFYISSETENENDLSFYLKSFLIFNFINLVQFRFIIKNDHLKSTSTTGGNFTFIEGLKSFYKPSSGKSSIKVNKHLEAGKLKFRRSFLFVANLSLVCLLIALVVEYPTSYYTINLIVKLLLVIDLQFTNSMLFELNGLSISFKIDDDHHNELV